MIYFKLPDPQQMFADRDKRNLGTWYIVSHSIAAFQIRRAPYLNWWCQAFPGFPEKFAGLTVRRVSWFKYLEWRARCFSNFVYGLGFQAEVDAD